MSGNGNIPGSVPLGGLMGPRGQMSQQQAAQGFGQMNEQQMIYMMQAAMESCAAKTVMSGVMGFGLGGMFGLFMSSMRYDAPMSLQGQAAGGAASISDLPMRQQLSHGLKDMGRSSWSSAKNFGMIGALFSGSECCIEGLRGKNELSNGVAAGCVTGGILARNGGPQAVALGCGGFAAFSAAIDYYMRMPENSGVGRVD